MGLSQAAVADCAKLPFMACTDLSTSGTEMQQSIVLEFLFTTSTAPWTNSPEDSSFSFASARPWAS